MQKGNFFLLALVILAITGFSQGALAGRDVYVNGYYRNDGTYVRPHVRSAPDSSRSNNYGPSTDSSQLMNPYSRDYDRDGAPNYLDSNDDNDAFGDEQDTSQYGYGR